MSWTSIPNVLPGRPALASWANAVKENIIALANGDSGAPRIQTAALLDRGVTNPKIFTDAIDQRLMQSPAAGETFVQYRLQEEQANTQETDYPSGLNSNYSMGRNLPFRVIVGGTISVLFEYVLNGASAGALARARVVKNGVVMAAFQTSSTTYVNNRVDISVVRGDLLLLQFRSQPPSNEDPAFPVQSRNARVFSNTDSMAVCG